MNLIIQHWDTDENSLPRWAKLAVLSIKKYSERIGCEYKLVTGFPMEQFSFDAKPVGQKLCAIMEEYDKYDDVLILDTDMVATTICENIFEHQGIGRLHKKGMAKIDGSKNGKTWPGMWEQDFPMFFGNCVKLNREQRIGIREVFPSKEFLYENRSIEGRPPNDEVVLSYCLRKGKIELGNKLELPHAQFCDLPEEAVPHASLLHFCGPRKNNIINWQSRLI